MYHQAWPWAAAATPSATSGFVQPTATTPVATTQWPAGYSQYTVTPELQQQWAAAWASQAQFAYPSNVPVGGDPQTTAAAFTGAYPDYQTAANTAVAVGDTAKKVEEANSSIDKPKNAAEQPASNDLAESDKIKQLKEQAEKWTSLQQSSSSSWSTAPSNSVPASSITTTAPNDSSKALTSTNVTQSTGIAQGQMSKEEEEFERQFKDWEKQFEAWKQQNQNHPDKEAFAQYEKQWQEWRAQLLQKKEQMQKAKAEQMSSSVVVSPQSSASGNAAGVVNTQTISTNITDTSSTSTTAMYYQHPSYMYMQPYMYPGATTVAPTAAMPPAVVPPVAGMPPAAAMPPTVMPPAMVPQAGVPTGVPPTGVPTGVPPVNMQAPLIPTSVPQQMPYNVPPPGPDNFGNQGHMRMPGGHRNENANFDNQRPQDFESEQDMYNYGPMRGNGPRDDGPGPNFDGFENPNVNMEGDFPRDDWKFARGRGRGGARGRGARGRGRDTRWGEPTVPPDVDIKPPGGIPNQRKTLLPGGPPRGPAAFPEDDGPPPFEYPTEDCRDEFFNEPGPFGDDGRPQNPPGNRFKGGSRFEGSQQFPQDDSFPPEQFDERFPPDQEFPDRFPPDNERFPPNKRFPPDRKRFPPDHERFPPDQERFPPGRDGFPPGQERFPPGRDGFPPGQERFPQGRDGFPPGPERFPPGSEEFPPEHDRFMPGKERFPRNDRFPPNNERFPPNEEGFPPDHEPFPPGQERFPPDQERFPPKGGRFPPGRNRFPPDEGFPPEDEQFPPDEGFPPPRRMMDEGGFGNRDFNEFPPEDDMYGPPPFRDDFPPFNERGGRGRGGRFPGPGRGRRFRGEFDRFGPFPPRMGNDFPPDFPPQPDDRFGFGPGDGPPRMPPPRGMRPPFEPGHFGGGGGPPDGRFPEEPFFDDGPQEFKQRIDYTHRPAAAVMGDDFNPHYEFEAEFQDDVNAYRARPPKRKKRDVPTGKKSDVEKKIKDKESDKDEAIEKDKAKTD